MDGAAREPTPSAAATKSASASTGSTSACRQAVCCTGDSDVAAAASLVAVGSVVGVALRLTTELGATDDSFSFLLANFLGSAVLAYTTAHPPAYAPLAAGIGTGLCGSLTTFSSWAEAVGALLLQDGLSAGEAAYKWVQIVVFGTSVMLAGWDLGTHLAVVHCAPSTSPLSPRLLSGLATGLGVVLLALLVLLAALGPTPWIMALLLGPPGAWLRWRLGKLNSLCEGFPVGTFAANVLGSALIAGAGVGGKYVAGGGGTVACSALLGFTNGFCGSLSTVSTFVKELKGLPRAQAYVYGVSSVAAGQAVVVIIAGGYAWSRPADYAPGSGACL